MALVEDVIGMLTLAIIVLVLAAVLGYTVSQRQSASLEEQQGAVRLDALRVAADAALHDFPVAFEPPTHQIIASFIENNGAMPLGSREALQAALERSFDAAYGRGNYYAAFTPVMSNIRVSFVIDGSQSLEQERQKLVESFPLIVSETRALTDADVTVYVYVLTSDVGTGICDEFVDATSCELITPDRLYTEQGYVDAPDFGYGTNEEWRALSPYPPAMDDAMYAEADWMAGMALAHAKFRQWVATAGGPASRARHVIVPLADELSTSSFADKCFADMAIARSAANYIPCAYCEESCPAERSRAYQEDLISRFTVWGDIVIGVFSGECGFTYRESLNNIHSNPVNTEWLGTDFHLSGENMCDRPDCTGCSIPGGLDETCMKTACQALAEEQLQNISEETGGELISIENLDTLPQDLADSVVEALSGLTLRIGIDDGRDRLVVERSIVLANGDLFPVRVMAYLSQYEDTVAPVIEGVYAPSMPEGIPVTVWVNVSDYGGVARVMLTVDGGETVCTPMGGMVYACDVSLMEGTYTGTIAAVDTSGNTVDASVNIVVGPPDTTPPTIHAFFGTPNPGEGLTSETTIIVNASDDRTSVSAATVAISAPDGSTQSTSLIDDGALWTGTAVLDQFGDWSMTTTVTDRSGNDATSTTTVEKTMLPFRVAIIPMGIPDESTIAPFINNMMGYYSERLPTDTCSFLGYRFEYNLIPGSYCAGVTCGCWGTDCVPAMMGCLDAYRDATGDDRAYNLHIAVTSFTADCGVSGVVGMAADIPSAYAGMVYSPGGTVDENILLSHELGHCMGLCHVGSVTGSQPVGVGLPWCNNIESTPTPDMCLMNYAFADPADEEYCPEGYDWLETYMSGYMEGCT